MLTKRRKCDIIFLERKLVQVMNFHSSLEYNS